MNQTDIAIFFIFMDIEYQYQNLEQNQDRKSETETISRHICNRADSDSISIGKTILHAPDGIVPVGGTPGGMARPPCACRSREQQLHSPVFISMAMGVLSCLVGCWVVVCWFIWGGLECWFSASASMGWL